MNATLGLFICWWGMQPLAPVLREICSIAFANLTRTPHLRLGNISLSRKLLSCAPSSSRLHQTLRVSLPRSGRGRQQGGHA